MSSRTAEIANSMEYAPTSADGHYHNFDQAYEQIVQLQNHDHGAGTLLFKQDMASLNQQLQADGVLPNLEIIGVDQQQHGLVTENLGTGQISVQNSANVNDFGYSQNQLPQNGFENGSAGYQNIDQNLQIPPEGPLNLLANALGNTSLGDTTTPAEGTPTPSENAQNVLNTIGNTLDNSQGAALGIMGTLLGAMTGQGSGSSDGGGDNYAGYQDAGDPPSAPATGAPPLGMNPMQFQSMQGFGDPAPDDSD